MTNIMVQIQKKKKKILLHVNMAYKHTESINKLI